MNHIVLKSDRLNLRKFILEDANFIFDLCNSAEWLKYIGERNLKQISDAEHYIQTVFLKSYEEETFEGYYVIELNEIKMPIGICGLVQRTYLDHLDYGFALLPQFMNQGYTYEISKKFIEYSKINFNLKHIYAITVNYNYPSIKLLEKLNFKFFKKIHPHDDEELMIYKISF